MITYYLMIAQTFPKTHIRKGQPTGFPLAIKHYDKIHTIRGNYNLWAKRFEKIDAGKAILSVRIWDGVPYHSNQIEIFKYDKTHNVGIQKILFDDYLYSCQIDDKRFGDMWWLSKNDGLSSEDFEDWFKGYDFSKPMAIIHFTDFRYNQ